MRKRYEKTLITRNIEIPMRDGVILRADHYQPVTDDKLPAIVTRTPYLKESDQFSDCYSPGEMAARGYHILFCDTRGSGQSDGVFYPFKNERNDGYDTIKWVSEQPWCDGRVGMLGLSYVGGTQIWAGSQNPPGLKCLEPGMTSGEWLPTFKKGRFFHRTSIMWYLKQARHALTSDKGDLTDERRQELIDKTTEYLTYGLVEQSNYLPFM